MTLQIIVWISTLLTAALIGWIVRMFEKLQDQKSLNILMERQLLDARDERDTWKETCHNGMERDTHRREVVAVLKKQVTNQAEQIDALLNGDRRCVKNHRYYTGQGISCPHCSGEEVRIHRCACGRSADVKDPSSGEWSCAACYIPF